jgi:hypothetical protein
VDVQIPTLPVDPTLIRRLPAPSAIIILLESPAARPVTLAPRIVLLDPVVIQPAVLYPRAVLLDPLVLEASDILHSAVLNDPILLIRDACPIAVFSLHI